MSVQVELLGWKSHGLRSPDHEIKLAPGPKAPPHHVTLIQMPNGAGKTTSLRLLRATLSGAARAWNPEEVQSMFRSGSGNMKGTFIVFLRVDGRQLTIELTLDRRRGSATYRTTRGSKGGIEEGYDPPASLQRFLEPSFVNLFVFDGELAGKLMEVKQTRAREAVDTVFQLSVLDELSRRFQETWEAHASRDTVKGEKGLSQRRNVMHRLKDRVKSLKSERDALLERRNRLEEAIEQGDEEYAEAMKRIESDDVELEQLGKQFEESKENASRLTRDVINKMRDPHALSSLFGDALKDLKQNLDRLRLPRSSSKEFFNELASMPSCICDRPNTKETRKAILVNAAKFLDDDEVGVLNEIKSAIGTYCAEDGASHEQELERTLLALNKGVVQRDQVKTKREAVEQRRLAEGGAEIQRMKDHLDRLRRERDDVLSALDEIERDPESSDDEDTRCLAKLEELLAIAEKEFALASHTVELKQKTEIIRGVLEAARTKARAEICDMLVTETNARIRKLLKMSPVALQAIEDRLILKEQGGASVGQTLSVGYAFLATLFGRATQRLPFVVDSPVGALDVDVRTEVARLLPSVSKQVVAFTISSERAGFVKPLHDTAKAVQYLTVFRKDSVTPKVEAALALHEDSITENDDCFVVEGRSFFEAFQPENE